MLDPLGLVAALEAERDASRQGKTRLERLKKREGPVGEAEETSRPRNEPMLSLAGGVLSSEADVIEPGPGWSTPTMLQREGVVQLCSCPGQQNRRRSTEEANEEGARRSATWRSITRASS